MFFTTFLQPLLFFTLKIHSASPLKSF